MTTSMQGYKDSIMDNELTFLSYFCVLNSWFRCWNQSMVLSYFSTRKRFAVSIRNFRQFLCIVLYPIIELNSSYWMVCKLESSRRNRTWIILAKDSFSSSSFLPLYDYKLPESKIYNKNENNHLFKNCVYPLLHIITSVFYICKKMQ